jgi:hypothetical protein
MATQPALSPAIGRDPILQRTVAIKKIDPRLQQKHSMLQRFFAEAQISLNTL